MSLAHRILQMKNKEDVFAAQKLAKEVHEKLTMLAFVEEYVKTTPNLETSKEELVAQVTAAFEKKSENKEEIKEEEVVDIPIKATVEEKEEEVKEETIVYDLIDDANYEPKEDIHQESKEQLTEEDTKEEPILELEIPKEEPIEQPFDELEELLFTPQNPNDFKNDVKDVGERKTPSLEDELQDTISVDVMADLFENAQPKSLNDKLASNIQVGLNDRIAFVKNLFEGDQENYNRVISQLNTFKTEKEAKKFIVKMVKPDYNWDSHEELEDRFMEIVSRKFA